MTRIKSVHLEPIGYVHRASKEEDVRDRTLVSRIIVRENLTDALSGIEDFSHIFVVSYLHEVSETESLLLKVHPRGRTDLPLLGVYATRTAFRPNPIGLTLVELIERKRNILVVKGLDAFDGTPVLDFKPADSRDMVVDLRVPAWCDELHKMKHDPSLLSGSSRNIDFIHDSKRL